MTLKTLTKNAFSNLSMGLDFSHPAIQATLGSIFLAIMAQISVPLPFTPVPLSLQTLGVALLAISIGKRNAALAVAAYLIQATVGLPVLAGGLSNPFWMIGPRAGYLIGFVVSAYTTGYLIEKFKDSSIAIRWLCLSANELCTLALGALWLSLFVGPQNALAMGALPFIPGALIKITVAATALRPIAWIKQK